MADKTIGELTEAAAIDDTSKIPGEQQGAAVYYSGKTLKDYAVAAASGYATAASGFADAANAAASAAADLKNLAGAAANEAEVQAEAAAEARQAIENMVVEAVSLATGDPASVSKELVDGVVKLILGIPRGERGEKGAYPDITEAVKGMVLTAGEDSLPVWQEAPESLPEGGEEGQVLTKKSGADGDAEWADLPSSGGSGKRTCRFTIGTSTNGWTEGDCDYLCDGTADEVEINAAIQALPENGGEIVVLDGTYSLDAPILANKANVIIKGNGVNTVLSGNILTEQEEIGLITVTANDVSVLDFQFRDSLEDVNNMLRLFSVLATGCDNCTVNRCRATIYTAIKIGNGCRFADVSNCSRNDDVEGGDFITLDNVADSLVTGNKATFGSVVFKNTNNSQFFNNKLFGGNIKLTDSNDNLINGNYFGEAQTTNIRGTRCNRNIVSQNVIVGYDYCLYFDKGGDNIINENVMTLLEYATGGMRFNGESGDTVQNNIIKSVVNYEDDARSIYLSGTGNANMLVTNNHIVGMDVEDGGGTNNTIANNKWQ